MALSKEELDTIKTGVNKAKQKNMAFAFTKTRKDGRKDPLLEIDLKESMVKKAIRTNGQPPLMWGSLQMIDKKTMAFILDKGKPKELQQAIMKGLKKAHPLLNKAQIFNREEYEAQLAAADGAKLAAAAAKAEGSEKKGKGGDSSEAGELETEALAVEAAATSLLADPKNLSHKELVRVALRARNFSDEKGGDEGRLKSIVEAATNERNRRRKAIRHGKEAGVRLDDMRKARTESRGVLETGAPGDKNFDKAVKDLDNHVRDLKKQYSRLKKTLER